MRRTTSLSTSPKIHAWMRGKWVHGQRLVTFARFVVRCSSDGGDIQMLAEPTLLHCIAFIDHSSKSRPSGRLLCVIVADHTTSSSWRMSAPGLIGTNRLRRKRSELNKLAPDPPIDSISLIFLAAWAKAADQAV
jgi:hypothetical protein